MSAAKFLLTFSPIWLLQGCCIPWQQPQPACPSSVRGWHTSNESTVRVLGEFILDEGQATESKSESLGIQVLKISPLITCLGQFSEPPRKEVRLRIYRPKGGQTICETTTSEGSGSLRCGSSQLPTMSVNGINTKERWVWFSLAETVSDVEK